MSDNIPVSMQIACIKCKNPVNFQLGLPPIELSNKHMASVATLVHVEQGFCETCQVKVNIAIAALQGVMLVCIPVEEPKLVQPANSRIIVP